MPAELKTLALYADDNGEPQQCVITHGMQLSPFDVDLNGLLPEFNTASTLFLMQFFEDRPDVTDGYGQEVPCHFIDMTGAARAEG